MATTFSPFSERVRTATRYLDRRCWQFSCWALPLLAMILWRLLLWVVLALAAGLHGTSWVVVVAAEALLEECAGAKRPVQRRIAGTGWGREWEWEWEGRERERVERVKGRERERREREQRERMEQRERGEREREQRERAQRERREREEREQEERERKEREDREREDRERNLREQQERGRNRIEDNSHQHSDLDSDSDSDDSDTPSSTSSSSSSSSPKVEPAPTPLHEPTKDTPSANGLSLQAQFSITANRNTPFIVAFKSEDKSVEPVIRTGGSRWLSDEEEYLLELYLLELHKDNPKVDWPDICEKLNARFARCRTQGACKSKYYKLRNERGLT